MLYAHTAFTTRRERRGAGNVVYVDNIQTLPPSQCVAEPGAGAAMPRSATNIVLVALQWVAEPGAGAA